MHACVVELKTAPAGTVAEVAAEADLRRMLADVLGDRLRLGAAAAGTHPIATGSDVAVSSGARYREIERTMGALARREPTMALHVHVAMPDGEAAVQALDGLRHDRAAPAGAVGELPILARRRLGFASARTPIFSMFPRGDPAALRHLRDVRPSRLAAGTGADPEPTFLWWDARLQPRLGTIEVRIMDAQTRVGDVAGLAAAVRCAVRRSAEVTRPDRTWARRSWPRTGSSPRDGMEAMLIDADRVRRPAREALAGLLDECRPVAQARLRERARRRRRTRRRPGLCAAAAAGAAGRGCAPCPGASRTCSPPPSATPSRRRSGMLSPTAIVDPFGLWPRAARLGRQTSVVAADTAAQTALVLLDRVLASPRSEQALDLVLRSRLAGQAVRSLVRGPLVEVALRTAVAEGLVERISAELVDSGAVDRVFDHLVSTEVPQQLADRLLAAGVAERIAQRVVAGPEIDRLRRRRSTARAAGSWSRRSTAASSTRPSRACWSATSSGSSSTRSRTARR